MNPFRHSIALVALLVVAACQSRDKPPTPPPAAAPATPPTQTAEGTAADQARIIGRPTAPIWVVEVSDFQCPFCKMWHDSTYAMVKREYVDAGKIRLAYINFPLGKHVNAMPAAEAAMCAAAQGRFWQMHDALFDAQAQWETMADPAPAFESLAARAGVDVAKMRACIKSHAVRAVIEGDIDRARVAGVSSTPSFLIGGEIIEGALPMRDFRQAIDGALAAQAMLTPKKP